LFDYIHRLSHIYTLRKSKSKKEESDDDCTSEEEETAISGNAVITTTNLNHLSLNLDDTPIVMPTTSILTINSFNIINDSKKIDKKSLAYRESQQQKI
jgi:hypothetical protein